MALRVVHFLVADRAIHFQDAPIVAEHVVGDGTGIGILHVRVDVHLDDAVGQRLADVLQGGAATPVEHQVERGVRPIPGRDRHLTVA